MKKFGNLLPNFRIAHTRTIFSVDLVRLGSRYDWTVEIHPAMMGV